MARSLSTCTRPGRRSASIPSTWPLTAFIPAARDMPGWPSCSKQPMADEVSGIGSQVSGGPPTPDTRHPTPVVEAIGLHKTYVSGKLRVPALRGVDLSIVRGEIVAIVGPSGCGKTTLLHCLSGLEDFEAGEVFVEGRPLRGMSDAQKAEQRAQRMGFVFQSYNLLPVLSAQENVELPLLLAGAGHGDARRRAVRALEVVGLENRLRHRPSEVHG